MVLVGLPNGQHDFGITMCFGDDLLQGRAGDIGARVLHRIGDQEFALAADSIDLMTESIALSNELGDDGIARFAGGNEVLNRRFIFLRLVDVVDVLLVHEVFVLLIRVALAEINISHRL